MHKAFLCSRKSKIVLNRGIWAGYGNSFLVVIFTKFHEERAKSVDFLLLVNFWPSSFFLHASSCDRLTLKNVLVSRQLDTDQPPNGACLKRVFFLFFLFCKILQFSPSYTFIPFREAYLRQVF